MLPHATIDVCSVGLALASQGLEGQKLRLIQIGACDGSVGDPIMRYMESGKPVEAVLLEPIPSNFEALKKNYKGFSDVRLLNIAIGDSLGVSEIFMVKNEGRWKNSIWAPQWASFSRDHLIRHGVAQDEIVSIMVATMPLAGLISEVGFFPHFLMIDTEGYDANIVRMAIGLSQQPRFICFEHLHINPGDLGGLYEELGLAGYGWLHDRMNSLAIKIR